MLTIEQCDNYIEDLKRRIRFFGGNPKPYEEEYIEHMRRLIKAYELERKKAIERLPEEEEEQNPIMTRWWIFDEKMV